ncbi:MAG: hypothetical protein RLZZ584_1850 [Pseudomonadota bacterium]
MSNPLLPATPTQSNHPRRVLVLGARGRFGAAAVQAFAAAGWQVLAQMRRTGADLRRGAQALTVPLADTAGLAHAAAGAQVVVHGVNPVYTRWRSELLPLAAQGMDVAARLGATFMLPGNVYNHGSTMPARLDGHTPEHADTVKGRLRVALEAELARRATAEGLASVVIRAGDFYGAGRGSWFDLVITKSLDQGKLVYPGPLDVMHAWAWLPDLARAFVAVAGQATARPHDWRGLTRLQFAGQAVTGADFLAALQRAAAALGRAPAGGWRHGTLPWGLLRAGGLVVPMWRELAEMAYLWRVPHALDGTALAERLGAALPAGTPLDEALRLSLIELGWLPQRGGLTPA